VYNWNFEDQAGKGVFALIGLHSKYVDQLKENPLCLGW